MNKKRISIITLIIGIIALVAGAIFLIIRLTSGAGVADGEYLISVGKWTKEGSPSVVWDFTEIGKGTLTTNNHINDYDFTWAIEDGKLQIQTEWLYTMDDAYEYSLDQNSKTLTLVDGDETIQFVPAE